MKTDEKRRKAIELKLAGLTYAEIGRELGLSFQRAQQLVRPPTIVYNAVRNRAKMECESCHIKLLNGHVHHKKPSGLSGAEFNAFDNLEYLCAKCHQSITNKERPLLSETAKEIGRRGGLATKGITSEKKKASGRINAAKAREALALKRAQA